MLGAMAEGARVLGDAALPERRRARRPMLPARLRGGPTAGCSGPSGGATAHLDAYLEDYAFLADGLLDLYEAGGDDRYLGEARGLAERILAEFAADGGGFYDTAEDTRR